VRFGQKCQSLNVYGAATWQMDLKHLPRRNNDQFANFVYLSTKLRENSLNGKQAYCAAVLRMDLKYLPGQNVATKSFLF